MKKCPMCAKDIQDEARKCKHCGEILKQVPGEQVEVVGTPARASAPRETPVETVAIAVLVVLLVPALFIGGLFLLTGHERTEKEAALKASNEAASQKIRKALFEVERNSGDSSISNRLGHGISPYQVLMETRLAEFYVRDPELKAGLEEGLQNYRPSKEELDDVGRWQKANHVGEGS